MATHTIRLRGPWEYQLLEKAVRLTNQQVQWKPFVDNQPMQIDIPFQRRQESLDNQLGRIRMIRRFHRPTNLSADDRVQCVCEQVSGIERVSLNQQEISSTGTKKRWEADITTFLERRNELAIELVAPVDEQGHVLEFAGEIFLEIES